MLLMIGLVALVGLVIGSFLNVVAWRVPRGESVVSPVSACPSCDHAIRPRDNVPVLGWVLLHGRCRDCGVAISARYPLVEGLTSALFAVIAWRIGLEWALPAFLYLTAVGVALALIDLDVQRLPDALTLPSYPVMLVLLGLAAGVEGERERFLRALICGAVAFGFFFVTWFVYPSGMGFGDVKLSGVLGLALGWISYGALFVGLFAGFLLGGVVSVLLVTLRDADRKTKIPFGPFLLSGTMLGVLVGTDLAKGYLDLIVG